VRVEVRLFGGLAERAGASRIEVDLPDGATASDLRDAVGAAAPAIAPLLGRVKVAVDLEVARDDLPLEGATEFALLPPVAGGAGGVGGGGAAGPVIVTGLRTPPLPVDATIAAVTGPAVGGTAVFLGTVRDHAPDLPGVTGLEYSAYPEMAEKLLADIADEVARDHPAVQGIALLHAVGDLDVGDHTILIVCAAAHRAPAFDACRDALERVKDRVPIWKRELTADGGHRWVGIGAEGDRPGPSPS
jgi:MoaE-MoaD fusion protein